MNAAQFCAEHGHENRRGAVCFRKSVVDKFITTYTYLQPSDFTDEMRKRLKIFIMIDLYAKGINTRNYPVSSEPEKIELPQSIFK